MDCIDGIEPAETTGESRIAIVTYASPGIMDYAAYSFAVNSAYAEHNGYEIFFLSPETGSNYEPRDQRWNRVKIIQEALDPSNGWLRDIQYIVWVDADLIFLDLEFSIEKLTQDFPHADIIISAERHAETGVANTGSFIIKNSPWSLQFLSNWWTKYDRSVAHDQIFFDKLYKSKLPDIANHVKILPTDAINSTPPPTLYQVDTNKVLHMMGQPSELRRKIFKLGFEEICHAYTSNEVIENQLGLSQPVLFSLGLQHYEGEVSSIISRLERTEYLKGITAEKYLSEASVAREDVLQISLYNPQIDQSDITQILFQSVAHMVRQVEQLSPSFTTPSTEEKEVWAGTGLNIATGDIADPVQLTKFLQSTEGRYLPSLYNAYAVYGNDLLRYLPSTTLKKSLTREMDRVLTKMETFLQRHQRHLVTELKVRLYTTMGHLEFDEKQYAQSIPLFEKSLQLLEELGEKGNPVYAIDPLMSIGSSHCMIHAVEEGIESFITAIEVQETLLYAEQQYKQDHITLATAMLRLGGCMAKGKYFREAKRVLSRAYDILLNHPEKSATNYFLEGWKRIDDRVNIELTSAEDVQFIQELERERLSGKYRKVTYSETMKKNHPKTSGVEAEKNPSKSQQQNSSPSKSQESEKGKVRKMMKKKKKSNEL